MIEFYEMGMKVLDEKGKKIDSIVKGNNEY